MLSPSCQPPTSTPTFDPRDPLTLIPGTGFIDREQLVLAYIAKQPGVRRHLVTCARCGAKGRPTWQRIGRRHKSDLPALPRCWEISNWRPDGDIVCADCIDKAINGAIAALAGYLKTPAGQAQLQAEAAELEAAA